MAVSGARPVLVLTGTTASGKNRVGAELARRLGGEVISLDSMKVYRGMDLGTDKPDAAQRGLVPHHLIDIQDPTEGMNLRRFVDLAHETAQAIRSRGALPVAVGGTALYLNGFLHGVFEGPEANPEFRRGLRAEAAIRGAPAIHERLAEVDAESSRRIHPNDYKRIERALEVYALTGKPISSMQGQWQQPPKEEFRLFILTWDRAVLDRRIEQRVDCMLEGGFVQEVRGILDRGGLGRESSQALGYREMVTHLRGEITLPEAADLIKRGTRRFARRQLTWFRRLPEARWVTAQEGDGVEDLVVRIEQEYQASLPPGEGRV